MVPYCRYLGAVHHPWTKPLLITLTHLGTHQPCSSSSNSSTFTPQIPEMLFIWLYSTCVLSKLNYFIHFVMTDEKQNSFHIEIQQKGQWSMLAREGTTLSFSASFHMPNRQIQPVLAEFKWIKCHQIFHLSHG